MAYATTDQVASGFRTLTTDEVAICTSLLNEAAVIIDNYNANAPDDAKQVVSCRMVRRAIGSGGDIAPLGATQGSVSALGYSQSWTMGSAGGAGELYLSKLDKQLLSDGAHRIGAHSPLEDFPC